MDESELVHYAVGFFGGDFDPNWYGYGSLGMYLLYGIYAVIGYVGVALGSFHGIDDFAQRLFSGGLFFIIGRFFFAVVGVTTIALYAFVARRSGISRVLVAGFLVVAATSPDAVYVANNIRSDSLVALFSALALLGAVMSSRPAGAYITAVACAAAIASKVSALPLALFLLGVLAYRISRREISNRTIFFALALFAVSLLAFQPFVNYPSRVSHVLGRAVDPRVQWSRIYYSDLPARVLAILSVLRAHVGLPILAVAPLGVFGISRWRDLTIFAVGLWGLLVAPFLTSPEVTFYWFIPLFNLTRLLALIGLAAILLKIRQMSFSDPKIRVTTRTSGAVLAGALLLPAVGGARAYAEAATVEWNNHENSKAAEKWLEQHLLGEEAIVLDPSFSYVLPKVYDPRDLTGARAISRAFIFDRHTNEFLSRIFYEFLWDDYARQHDLLDVVRAVQSARIDLAMPEGSVLSFREVQVCNPYRCELLTPVRSKDVLLTHSGDGDFDVRITGADPYIVLFDERSIASDGSVSISFEQSGSTLSAGYLFVFKYGEDRPTRRAFRAETATNIKLGHRASELFVRRANPANVVRSDGRSLSGTFFVTSSAIYRRFLEPTGTLDEPKQERLRILRPYYEKVFEHGELVKRFADGVGPAIEIYEVPERNSFSVQGPGVKGR